MSSLSFFFFPPHNDRYCHLPKYHPFLVNHPVCKCQITQSSTHFNISSLSSLLWLMRAGWPGSGERQAHGTAVDLAPSQCILGVSVPQGQTSGRDAVRASSASAELKQACSSSYTFSTPITLHAVMLSLRTKVTYLFLKVLGVLVGFVSSGWGQSGSVGGLLFIW